MATEHQSSSSSSSTKRAEKPEELAKAHPDYREPEEGDEVAHDEFGRLMDGTVSR